MVVVLKDDGTPTDVVLYEDVPELRKFSTPTTDGIEKDDRHTCHHPGRRSAIYSHGYLHDPLLRLSTAEIGVIDENSS